MSTATQPIPLTPTDSDPDADELLRRVRQGNPRPGVTPSPDALAALRRLTAVVDAVAAEQAEQRRAEEDAAWDDWARGVAA